MHRVGLVLPTGGYRGPDFVDAADELGVELVVLSDGSLGVASGRIVRALEADCDRPEEAAAALVAVHDELPLDAIVSPDDQGVMIAALAATEIGLPNNSPAAVAATRDKGVMRDRFAEAGIPQPAYRRVETDEEVEAAVAEIGVPVVVKPVSLSASRGVIRADDAAAAVVAAHRIRGLLDEPEPLLVEEFVGGPEIAIEGLTGPAGLEVLAVFDKPDPLDGPYFEETIYVTPSRHDRAVLDETDRIVAVAIEALGIGFGPVHAEVRLTEEGPRMIEVAARSIGGLCGRSLRFGMLGQSLEVLLLRSALGLETRGMRREERASGVMMLPIPERGRLVRVRGGEAVYEVEGITDLQITVPPGRHLEPLPDGDRYLGFLFADGDEPGDVEASLREAHGLLEVVMEPSDTNEPREVHSSAG